MKKLLGLLAVFFLFLAAIVVALAIFPPTGLSQRLLTAGVRSATGLDLKIDGPMSLKLLPSVTMRMENVSLVPSSGAAGGNASAPLASAQVLEVKTSIGAALGGDKRVDSIRLTGAKIDLAMGPDGVPVGVTPSTRRSPAAGRGSGHVSVGTLELVDSTIDYRDQRSELSARLDTATVTLREARLDQIGEALIKAGAAAVRDPRGVGSLDVTNLDAKVAGFDGVKAREAQGTGQAIKWQAAGGETSVEGSGVTVSARGVSGGGAESLNLASATAAYRTTALQIDATGLTGSGSAVASEGIAAIKFNAGGVKWRDGSLDLEAHTVAGEAATLKADRTGPFHAKAQSVAARAGSGRAVTARDVDARGKSFAAGRVEDLDVRSERTSIADTKRSQGMAEIAIEKARFQTPLFASDSPIEGKVALGWRNETLEGQIKLPSPETIAKSDSIPASLAMDSLRGKLDFEGTIDASSGTAKGKTRVTTAAVEQAAQWLGFPAPAALKGQFALNGDVEANGRRIALSNGRVEHAGNAVAGTLTVDLGGARPKFSGRLQSDALDIEPYLGLEPVKPKPQTKPTGAASSASAGKPQVIEPEVQLADVFKTTLRAMLEQPAKRDGTLEIPDVPVTRLVPPAATRGPAKQPATAWSDQRFDVSALRDVDLDIDWSVKQLGVRGMQLNVPQLKTVLDGGRLQVEGRDVGTKDGKLSGRAEIDAREAVPAIAANVKGEGVDLYQLSAALGITPVIDGDTSVEADVKARGSSQKQLIESLSGSVRTNMPQGHVLGYDLGNITLGTFLRWITGNREYDPERRTAISGLKADLKIDKGVVSDSQVVMGGPLLGVNAEGTIGLVDQRIDYRGRARIASWFSGLPFKIFGDLSKPTFQPDLNLASVFSRAPPGEPTLKEIIEAADIKEDAELALLIGRVLVKAGPTGLDAGTIAALNALQAKAIGRK